MFIVYMAEMIYITKVYRSGSSLVTAIPSDIVRKMKIEAGDRLKWRVDGDAIFVKIWRVSDEHF